MDGIAISDGRDVLLVVDIQKDFCPGGALAVTGGGDIVPLANQLATIFAHVVLTQDWHSAGHLSFASSHPDRKPFDTVEMPYGPQVLWPDHCVQGTRGAEFHAALTIPRAELVLRKGYHHAIDSYSALFRERSPHADRAFGLLGGTRFRPPVHLRLGLGFPRRLLGARRARTRGST